MARAGCLAALASALMFIFVGCGGSSGTPSAPCSPACRVGFACELGTCVTACNPPCANDEMCAASGNSVTCVPRDTSTGNDASMPPTDANTPPTDMPVGSDVAASDAPAGTDTSSVSDTPADGADAAISLDASVVDGHVPTDGPTGMDLPGADTVGSDAGTPIDTTPVPCGLSGQPCCESLACRGGTECDTASNTCVIVGAQMGECHRPSDCHMGSSCAGPSGCGSRWCYVCLASMGVEAWDATCTTSYQCASGVCYQGRCSAACDVGGTGNADCAAVSTSAICVGYLYGLPPISDADIPADWQTLGACAPSCARNGDCTGGRVCTPTSNLLLDRLDFTCQAPLVMAGSGSPCTDGSTCASSLCLTGAFADGGGACTSPCVANMDCPAAAPVCAPIIYDTPSGGTQPGNACVPSP